MAGPAYGDLGVTFSQGFFSFKIVPGSVLGPAGLPLPQFDYSLPPKPVNFGFGSGAGQVNIIGTAKGTLTAAPVSIDLLTALKDPNGTALAFSKIKALLFWNYSTTAGQNMLVDGTVSNAFGAYLNNIVTAKLVVGPGEVVSGNSVYLPVLIQCVNTGFTVDATHKIVTLDPGANTFGYEIEAIGIST